MARVAEFLKLPFAVDPKWATAATFLSMALAMSVLTIPPTSLAVSLMMALAAVFYFTETMTVALLMVGILLVVSPVPLLMMAHPILPVFFLMALPLAAPAHKSLLKAVSPVVVSGTMFAAHKSGTMFAAHKSRPKSVLVVHKATLTLLKVSFTRLAMNAGVAKSLTFCAAANKSLLNSELVVPKVAHIAALTPVVVSLTMAATMPTLLVSPKSHLFPTRHCSLQLKSKSTRAGR